MYYTSKCPDSPKKASLHFLADSNKCLDETVESTFNPSPCETYEQTPCFPYNAVELSTSLINESRGQDEADRCK